MTSREELEAQLEAARRQLDALTAEAEPVESPPAEEAAATVESKPPATETEPESGAADGAAATRDA